MRRYGYRPEAEAEFRPGARVAFRFRTGEVSNQYGTVMSHAHRDAASAVGPNPENDQYWLVAWDHLSQMVYPESLMKVLP